MSDPNVLAELLPSMVLHPCLAYLDPATGGMLLQLILGGVGGLAIALKFGWRRIARTLGFSKHSDEAAENAPDSHAAQPEEPVAASEEAGKRAA